MAKRAILVLAALLLFISAAQAEKSMDLGNGLLVTYPDEWEASNYTWTKGNEMLLLFPADLRSSALDLDSMDKHELLAQFGKQLMITDMEDFQSYYPLNGFFVATAEASLQNNPCQIAMLLQDRSLCILVYFHLGDKREESDLLDFVDWFSYMDSETAETPAKTEIRKEGNRYYLDKVPLILELSEDEYDIVYSGMPRNAESVLRSKYSYDQINGILSAGIGTDMMIWQNGTDGLAQKAPTVSIRIKDGKYDGIDFRAMNDSAKKEICDALVPSMAQDGQYRMETINGIPYAAFKYATGNEFRYATILNGDMIYVYLKSPAELKEEDQPLLRTVLENLRVSE